MHSTPRGVVVLLLSLMKYEMILFLKENKDLWGVEDVHHANLNRLSANKNLRVEKKMAEHAEMMANNN